VFHFFGKGVSTKAPSRSCANSITPNRKTSRRSSLAPGANRARSFHFAGDDPPVEQGFRDSGGSVDAGVCIAPGSGLGGNFS
jgi:hypothetical protein